MAAKVLISAISIILLSIPLCSYTLEGYITLPQFSDGQNTTAEIFLDGNKLSPDQAAIALPQIRSRTDKKGYFFFENIEDGNYRLKVSSHSYIFPTYLIEASEGLRAYEVDEEHHLKTAVPLPLRIAPKGEFKYFDVKQPFDLNSLMKSPYGIMIAVTIGLLLCMKNMPKMEDLQAADRVQRNN